jgi:NADH-quinone oxidoreductase subunit M
VVAPLIALLIGLGVYPKIALDVINPAVTATLTSINEPDPAPTLAEPSSRERSSPAQGTHP